MKSKKTTSLRREGVELLAMLPSGMTGPIKMVTIHGFLPERSIVIICDAMGLQPPMTFEISGGKMKPVEWREEMGLPPIPASSVT